MAPARTKYNDRSPRTAKALEVNTTNGSRVTPKTAGMESAAKTMSLASTATRAISSGVAIHVARRTKNRSPS